MKILAIGNSFAEDTFWLTPQIALSMGLSDITFAHLYFGGCSINRHILHANEDLPAYEYRKSSGGEWDDTPSVRMRTALEDEAWDWIILSTGTGDGSRWTEAQSYVRLPELIAYVKQYVPVHTKFAFNVTWTGETSFSQPDLDKFHGDQIAMLNAINEIVRAYVTPLPEISAIIPTGVAVQNLRESYGKNISRDGYHLSYDLGRYTAGVTAMMTLTGCPDIARVTYTVADEEITKKVRLCVVNALKTPFAVTRI